MRDQTWELCSCRHTKAIHKQGLECRQPIREDGSQTGELCTCRRFDAAHLLTINDGLIDNPNSELADA